MQDNSRIIVDAHHHFWDPTRVDYPWMSDELAPIRRPFAPGDLRPLLRETGVNRTVLIQTRSSLEETREFLATAAATDFVGGVVGWVDLTDPSVAETLAVLQAQPEGQYLVGIRHQVHDEPDPNWLLREEVGRGLAAIRDADLACDLLVRPLQLSAVLTVARTFPGLRFVIDHIAKPEIANREMHRWTELMNPFTRLDNVSCKLSGMVTEANWQTWTVDDLQPYVQKTLEIFGEDRVMFGSDWPVCLLAASYQQVFCALELALGDISEEARAQIFGRNAIRVYRLNVG